MVSSLTQPRRLVAAEVQPRAVRDHAALTEEPGIGATDDEAGQQVGTRVGGLRGRRDRVPQLVAAGRLGGITALQPPDLDVIGQFPERFVEVGVDVGLGGAGHGADVDLDLDEVGDDVRLLAAVHDVRRERGVGVGMAPAGHSGRQRLDRRPDSCRVDESCLHAQGASSDATPSPVFTNTRRTSPARRRSTTHRAR